MVYFRDYNNVAQYLMGLFIFQVPYLFSILIFDSNYSLRIED